MTVILVFPPFSTGHSGPPASLSALVPYLLQHDVDVRAIDLNIEFLWNFFRRWPQLKDAMNMRLEAMAQRRKGIPTLSRKIEEIRRVEVPMLDELRRRADKKAGSLVGCRNFRLVQKIILDLVNAYFFDDLFIETGHIRLSYAELSERVKVRLEDRFLETLLEGVNWQEAEFAGFSLLSEMQLPYAMILARVLRAVNPGIRTIAGGAYITEMLLSLASEPMIFNDFDFFVAHEGESALLKIIRGEISSSSFHPNIISKHQGSHTSLFLIEDIESLPYQDFSQFKLNLYRPDGLSLPFYSSKGCTWGRCAFCSTNFLRYRDRDMAGFLFAAARTGRESGVRVAQLVDEDVTPERLSRFAAHAAASEADQLQWSIQTRFYPKLDRELLVKMVCAGIVSIEFGLESASERILKSIRKGISLKAADRIISLCADLGIKVILNFMVGFPGEEERDAHRAIEFIDALLVRYPNLNVRCNTQIVKIYLQSDFHRRPELYSVSDTTMSPLSPIADWTGPDWVQKFVRQFKSHLLFSKKNSIEDRQVDLAALGSDPRCSVSEEWVPLTISGDHAAYHARVMIAHAQDADYTLMEANSTMAELLDILLESNRLSQVKERFILAHSDIPEDMVRKTLAEALFTLNDMGVVAFNAD